MANEFKIKKGLIVTGASGGTVVDIQGSQGQLFSVTDNLSGSIFAVSDISGVPIFDVNSSGVSYFDGKVGIGTSNPDTPLHVFTNTSGYAITIEENSGTEAFQIGVDSVGSLDFFNSKSGTSQLSLIDDGNSTFSGLVSGITPVNAANFVTKAYADGLTPGAGVFLPLVGGTMANTNLVTNMNADLLDGQQGSYYVDTATAQSIAGVKSFSGKIGADGGIDGLTNANGISGSNYNITGVNVLQINDPGEAIEFSGTTTVYLDVIDDAVDDKLRIRNATQLDLNSTARITNLVNPTGAQDAATKSYVDTEVELRSN